MQEVQEDLVNEGYLSSTRHVPSKGLNPHSSMRYGLYPRHMVHGHPIFSQPSPHIRHCKIIRSVNFSVLFITGCTGTRTTVGM